MGRKSKYSFELKMDIVLRCLNKTTTAVREGKRLGIRPTRIYDWISLYQSMGEEGLITTSKNKLYSAELKANAVSDYLSGKGSQQDICRKYKIHSSCQLRYWIMKYNGHKELKASGKGGRLNMTKGRKTTFEERVEIVQYCSSHMHDYSETAEKYGISYQQARNYTVKYEKDGVDALQDRRGKRKDYDSLTEIEKLRAELKLEKVKRQKAEMEVSFLKKLDEIERRRG